MSQSPLAAPDADEFDPPSLPAPWRWSRALGWSVAGAAAMFGLTMVARAVGEEHFPLAAPGVPDSVPLWQPLALGAACGLAAAVLVGVLFGLSLRDACRLTAIACGAGVTCGAVAFVSVAAFPLVGFAAGFAGYAWARPVAAEPALAGDRLFWLPDLRPSAHVLPVVVVGTLFVVAAFVGPPSEVGLVVLGVGVLGLAVAQALAAQERRIRELERRLAARDGEGVPDVAVEMN